MTMAEVQAAYDEGRQARNYGVAFLMNPYSRAQERAAHRMWQFGWSDCDRELRTG